MDERESQRRLIAQLLCDPESGNGAAVSDASWRALLEVAHQEGVAPLLARALEGASTLRSTPAWVTARLRRERFRATSNNLLIYGELERILSAIDGGHRLPPSVVRTSPEAPAGTSVAVLKGADLALTVYPSMGLRPMSDLDLLVSAHRLDPVIQELQRLGYRRCTPELAKGHDRVTDHALTLQGGPGGCVQVDVHWRLVAGEADRRSPPTDWFWEQTEWWTPDNEVAPCRENLDLPRAFARLRPEAHLLFLSAHLILQHAGSYPRLLWLKDLDLLLGRYRDSLDWDQVLRRSGEFRWETSLCQALRATSNYFGTCVPREIRLTASARSPRSSAQPLGTPPPGDDHRALKAWRQMTYLGWRARLCFAAHHLFPSKAYLKWRYAPRPSWLWPFCYAYRWGVVAAGVIRLLQRRWLRVKSRTLEEPRPAASACGTSD